MNRQSDPAATLTGMADNTFTPTATDLDRIRKFIEARDQDENRLVGGMDYHAEHGITVTPHVLPSADDATAKNGQEHVQQWVDSHTPERFADLTGALSRLASSLVTAANVALHASPERRYAAQDAWASLTMVARLWDDHPDFLPEWADDESAASA